MHNAIQSGYEADNKVTFVSDSLSSSSRFTQEQMNQLLQLLLRIAEIQANMAGMTILLSKIKGVDSTNHMACNNEWLTDLLKSDNAKVQLPNGNFSNVANIRNYTFSKGKTLHNILPVLDFKFSLLSISKLTRVLSCYVSFFFFQHLWFCRTCQMGRYWRLVENLQGFTCLTDSCALKHGLLKTIWHRINAWTHILWHKRLRHPSEKTMKYVSNLKHVHNKQHDIKQCKICLMEKMWRLHFDNKRSRACLIFELIHADIYGPHCLPSHDNKRFFLTFVDDYSRSTWVYMIQHKIDSVIVLKMFFALIENWFHSTIKRFRWDNGWEFFNNQLKSFF